MNDSIPMNFVTAHFIKNQQLPNRVSRMSFETILALTLTYLL